jgi:hypothetical protein
MVQPLSPASPAKRPELPAARPVSNGLTIGNNENFRRLMRAANEPPVSIVSGDPTGASETRQPLREHREIPEGEERSGALAPDDQSSWGRVNPDPAEWLSVITSTGGVSESRPAEATAPAPAVELSELVSGWVRRVALGGDPRRAVARLDIGHGRYAGAELLITAEGSRISVELTLPEGVAVADLSERLGSRLTARGYAAEVAVR